MPVPRLHAITDDARLAAASFVDDAAAVLEAGGPDLALHLRGRTTTAARLHEIAVALLPVARAAGSKLLVNDRVDVALVARGDGAQLPEDSMEPADARRILGPDALIGVSRHGPHIDESSLEPADFVIWGTVFQTASHPGREGAGLDALWKATSSGKPVVAIGGITPDRVSEVLAQRAHGVAALSGIWDGGAEAIESYRAALEEREAASGAENGSEERESDA